MFAHTVENKWLGELDELCDRFEAAWKAGSPQAIEQFVASIEPDRRPVFTCELIQLEIEYRKKADQLPTPGDYRHRFPELKAEIDGLFLEPTVIAADHRAMVASLPRPAQRIGDFEIIERLKAGGMGVVYKARQVSVNRLVALKLIRSGDAAGSKEIARFQNEAEAAAKLEHPGIVPVFGSGSEDGQHYIAMALIDGPSLAERIAQGPMPARESAELVRRLAVAVDYAHRHGVIHRDLKPGNILLAPLVRATDRGRGIWDDSGTSPTSNNAPRLTYEPKITDFGLAKLTERDRELTETGEILGTLEFMPPEQASGRMSEVGAKADVYSLGAILYRLLAGRPPFQAASQAELIRQLAQDDPVEPRLMSPGLHRDLETICLKCLEKKSERRFSTASDLAAELQRFLSGEPILSRHITRLERAWRWCQRNPLVSSLTATIGAVFVVGTIVSSYFAFKATAEAKRADERTGEAVASLYAANMNLAQLSWESARVASTLELLKRWEPRPGETDLRGWEWFYLKRLCDNASLALQGHTGWVRNVAFTSDGRLLASASADRTVKLWDAATRQELRTLQGHTDEVWWVAFSPDNRHLASASWDGTLKLWDTATGEELRTFKGHTDRVQGVAFSPDGQQLVSAGEDHSIRIWDVAMGRELKTLKGHSSGVRGVAFSPDGGRVASASYDGTIKVWDLAIDQVLHTLDGHHDRVWSVAFSPDGKFLASGSVDQMVKLWNANTGQEIRTFKGHTAWVWCVAFSPDGKLLASASWDQTVRIWDIESGQQLRCLRGHTNKVLGVTFHPHDQCVVSCGEDKSVKFWSLSNEANSAPNDNGLLVLHGHTSQVNAVAFSPDGVLASSSADETVKLWDMNTAQELRTITGHGRGEIVSIAFGKEGRRIASAGQDRTVKLWDSATGQLLHSFGGHTDQIRCVAFSPDGKTVASASADKTVKLWDVESAQELRTIRGHSADVTGVAFSSDARLLASASGDQTVKLWETATGKVLHTLKGHTSAVLAVAFDSDSQRLASAGLDQTVKLWDTDSGQEVRTLKGHALRVTSVAFSPDGRRLASASDDQTVKVWDSETGYELLTIKGHASPVFGVAFSPDGRRLAAADYDRTVKVADAGISPPKLLRKGQRIHSAKE